MVVRDCNSIEIVSVEHEKCLHCRLKRGYHDKRGLCHVCYNIVSIRRKYPTLGCKQNRGHGVDNRDRPCPPDPTSALPGTPRKILVMEERAANGFAVFHPDDASISGEMGRDKYRMSI